MSSNPSTKYLVDYFSHLLKKLYCLHERETEYKRKLIGGWPTFKKVETHTQTGVKEREVQKG